MSEQTYPYDSTSMNYSLTKHMYILNSDYVTNEMGEDLLSILNGASDTKRASLVNRFLERISRIVYNFIYSYVRNDIKDYEEYLLAKEEDWREPIQEALEEQLLYVLRNGDLTTYNGVDLYKGTKLQLKREDTISPLAKDILANAGILYTGFYEVPLEFDEIKRSDY